MKIYHVVQYDPATKENVILATRNTEYDALAFLLCNENFFSLFIDEEEVPDAPREFYVDCEVEMICGTR